MATVTVNAPVAGATAFSVARSFGIMALGDQTLADGTAAASRGPAGNARGDWIQCHHARRRHS